MWSLNLHSCRNRLHAIIPPIQLKYTALHFCHDSWPYRLERNVGIRREKRTTTKSIYAHKSSHRRFPSSLDHCRNNRQRMFGLRISFLPERERNDRWRQRRRRNVRPFVVGRYLPFFLPLSETLLSIERERRWWVTGRLFTYFNLPISRLPTSSLPPSPSLSLSLSPLFLSPSFRLIIDPDAILYHDFWRTDRFASVYASNT